MFLSTDRIEFSKWTADDLEQAKCLWGDSEVTRYICATGVFSPKDIEKRLNTEVSNGEEFGLQYWPIFHKVSGELIGCCGLRPRAEKEYEIGFHLRPKFWRQGYAVEAANAVIDYAFEVLKAEKLFAGHNPKNAASKSVLGKLGFTYIGDEFYAPTGLYHPSYEMKKEGRR
ncbi:MAG: GNAT family N-acetyltransferase [Lachnospiraceae bacterium]|nr:GNAT family N-acetyltransferase [Lachnospiraceae bacterium]MBQ6857082.1 GNAT family N-acetyltransferase [Lachnospiraceae bacterium]